MIWYFRTHQPHKEVKIHIVYEDGTHRYRRQGLYVLLTYVERTLTDSPEGTFMTEKSGDEMGYGDHSFLAARLTRRNKRVLDKLIAYIEGHKEELHAAYLRHNVRWMSEIIRAFEAPIVDRWETDKEQGGHRHAKEASRRVPGQRGGRRARERAAPHRGRRAVSLERPGRPDSRQGGSGVTQTAVLMTDEEVAHEARREDLYAAHCSCMDAATRMKRVAAAWPDKFYRASLNNIVDDLEQQNRRIVRAINRCNRRDYGK